MNPSRAPRRRAGIRWQATSDSSSKRLRTHSAPCRRGRGWRVVGRNSVTGVAADHDCWRWHGRVPGEKSTEYLQLMARASCPITDFDPAFLLEMRPEVVH